MFIYSISFILFYFSYLILFILFYFIYSLFFWRSEFFITFFFIYFVIIRPILGCSGMFHVPGFVDAPGLRGPESAENLKWNQFTPAQRNFGFFLLNVAEWNEKSAMEYKSWLFSKKASIHVTKPCWFAFLRVVFFLEVVDPPFDLISLLTGLKCKLVFWLPLKFR